MSILLQGPGSWWQLPGPHQLVEAVADDLDQGKCVVVRLPQHLPNGFYEAVTHHLQWQSGRGQRWLRLPGSLVGEASEERILAWLYERVGLEADEYIADKSIAHLCGQPAFQGNRFVLEQLSVEAAAGWGRFLAEYQYALNDQSYVGRSTFFLILEGAVTTPVPSANTNLAVHTYGPQVGTDDIRLLLRFVHLGFGQAEPALKCELRQSIVAALASADPVLAHQLVSRPFAELLQPAGFLADYASRRSWQVGPVALPLPAPPLALCQQLWTTGGWVHNADRPCVHSALLALHGRSDLLASRIWEGQLTVLLPFIERKRQVLLDRYKDDLLRLLPHTKLLGPHKTVEVQEIAELELGDLYFLRTKPELRRHGYHLSQELYLLWKCRVELAHQRVVDEVTIDELLALN
ncbi:hypothetical protein BEN47_09915 [Hymenobacter lapidarius]|uniref:Uncharacterized protein n=1 Tax=Hymenobacter lapidarius TaxID=1908237 RepID=A0A1G1TB02_9BACT|nr:hypothetical protein [Hymenobacter lapidarius]OGX88053.1 hypothetical protein BEN47_09915 [Hymenobacter lapidarius]